MNSVRSLNSLACEPFPLPGAALAGVRCVALHADNSPDWLRVDHACALANRPCLPLPQFFTEAQMRWALESAGADSLITDSPSLPLWVNMGFGKPEVLAGSSLVRLKRDFPAVSLPEATAKITFTSGSTGYPKAVCLRNELMESVAGSVAELMQAFRIQRHLCAMPLPVLLENVAGAVAALKAGAECIVPPMAEIGWCGSSVWDPEKFLKCLRVYRPHSFILLPQMLKSLLPLVTKADTSSLRFVAVGGGKVSPGLVMAAREAGLPVYEGYGLSECGSVVCLNRPGADRAGSVGQRLKHTDVRINASGELEVKQRGFAGYLGQQDFVNDWWPTGDLATIDHDGFVTITGRRKNLIISSFGRNISPEWVESELLGQGGILQAAVFGEAKPWLSAVLFAPGLSGLELARAVARANASLPDYARVNGFVRAAEPFTDGNGLATSNGRNKRDAIANLYADSLDALYCSAGELTA